MTTKSPRLFSFRVPEYFPGPSLGPDSRGDGTLEGISACLIEISLARIETFSKGNLEN
ncbi:hypothetical protein LNA02_09310 [Levilactobacillus namurensis]|nr:hypothetical protein LNA02_09310 [Levilactobacillus namurensis]